MRRYGLSVQLEKLEKRVGIINASHPKENVMLKKYCRTLAPVVIFFAVSALAFAEAGKLDPSFGSGGIVTIDFGVVSQSGFASINAAAVQSDGKIVVAGGIPDGNGHGVASFFVARFLSNGTLDATFGHKGISVIAGSGGIYTSVLIQPDGKIVAAGGQVARYKANGDFDDSFGTKGIVTLPEFFSASVVTLDSKGEILVGGNILDANGFVALLLPDGSLDTSFGVGQQGAGTTSILGTSVTQLARLANGDILASGNQNGQLVVALTSGGLPDLTFGLSSQLSVPSSVGGLAVASTGDILVAGTEFLQPTASTPGLLLTGYQSIGIADPSFATNGGTITALPGASSIVASGLGLEPNGEIVIGGSAAVSGQRDFALARYSASGQLDTSFGTHGTVETSFSGSTPTANGLTIQPDGKILAFGGLGTIEGGSTDTKLLIARYLSQ
jgi:uncharacterized delta-60 repeat protein